MMLSSAMAGFGRRTRSSCGQKLSDSWMNNSRTNSVIKVHWQRYADAMAGRNEKAPPAPAIRQRSERAKRKPDRFVPWINSTSSPLEGRGMSYPRPSLDGVSPLLTCDRGGQDQQHSAFINTDINNKTKCQIRTWRTWNNLYIIKRSAFVKTYHSGVLIHNIINLINTYNCCCILNANGNRKINHELWTFLPINGVGSCTIRCMDRND